MLINHIAKYLPQIRHWQKNKASYLLLSTLILFNTMAIGAVKSPSTNPAVNLDLPKTLEDIQPLANLPEYVVIQPSDEATFSSETSASVDKIFVKEGNAFHKNTILLTLDCRVQNAELKKAQAQQEVSNLAYISAKKLKSYGSISDLEYLQAESQKDIADADVDKLSSIVEKCTIKAPFNGSVAKLMVHQFETVKPGDPLLKVISTDNLDFVVQIPSSWLDWLHIGSIFTVHVNELNKVVPVKVTKINPEIDSVSQTVKVVAKQTDPDPSLLPGMSGQASFPDNPKNNSSKLK